MRIRTIASVAAAALILSVAVGCSDEPSGTASLSSQGGPGSATSALSSDTPADIKGDECEDGGPQGDVLRGSENYDYEGFRSVGEAVTAVDVVASGRIAQWSAGRSIIDAGDATRFAVIAIDVDEPIKGIESRRIYVKFDLGSEGLDEEGTPIPGGDGSSTVLSLEEASQAAPVGTEVLFLGEENPPVEEEESAPNVHVVNPRAGLPDGAVLLAAYPQGLLLKGCDGETVSAIVDEGDIDAWVASLSSVDGQTGPVSAKSGGSFALLVKAAAALTER